MQPPPVRLNKFKGVTKPLDDCLRVRLIAGLATNAGVQPKRTEIWRRLKSLTPREVDVLCYVLGGQLNREIAAELGITERTIKVHRGRVMEKLGVQSTAQLFPMVLRYLAWPAWPKFRRRRKKPKRRRPARLRYPDRLSKDLRTRHSIQR
jgi:DNA-binding CsgD family transcriptional regulator